MDDPLQKLRTFLNSSSEKIIENRARIQPVQQCTTNNTNHPSINNGSISHHIKHEGALENSKNSGNKSQLDVKLSDNNKNSIKIKYQPRKRHKRKNLITKKKQVKYKRQIKNNNKKDNNYRHTFEMERVYFCTHGRPMRKAHLKVAKQMHIY